MALKFCLVFWNDRVTDHAVLTLKHKEAQQAFLVASICVSTAGTEGASGSSLCWPVSFCEPDTNVMEQACRH